MSCPHPRLGLHQSAADEDIEDAAQDAGSGTEDSRMNLGLKIIWASSKPSVRYLRLIGALRFHGVPLVVPVLPPVQDRPKRPAWRS